MAQNSRTEPSGAVTGVTVGASGTTRQHQALPHRALGMRTLFVGAGIMALGMVALATWMIHDSRTLIWDRAVQASENVTVTLAHEIELNAESYDLAMQAVASGLSLPGLSPAARRQVVVDHAVNAPYFGAMLVVDETGRIVIDSSRAVPSPRNLAGRDYFQVQRDHSPGLFVSAPVRRESESDWRIYFSRRLEHPDGSFAGIVASSIHLNYYRNLFERVALGRNGSIALFRSDGIVMMRVPYEERLLGTSMAQARVFEELDKAPYGTFETIAAVDEVPRLYAYRRV
ncbi:MAG: hypothetical protein JO255_09535, partial [Alphaproteobacteria bacterium]|nr:hypothetical protein [Alphaproteobacteria bacterium]